MILSSYIAVWQHLHKKVRKCKGFIFWFGGTKFVGTICRMLSERKETYFRNNFDREYQRNSNNNNSVDLLIDVPCWTKWATCDTKSASIERFQLIWVIVWSINSPEKYFEIQRNSMLQLVVVYLLRTCVFYLCQIWTLDSYPYSSKGKHL